MPAKAYARRLDARKARAELMQRTGWTCYWHRNGPAIHPAYYVFAVEPETRRCYYILEDGNIGRATQG